MFYQQPPVGNPVCLFQGQDTGLVADVFKGYQARYFSSGTAALAAALIAARQQKQVSQPEVLLPAYACPDLISAAVYADVKPVLVDFEANRPWMDLDQLQAKLSQNTVAVIAVDLFGISERLEQIHPLVEQVGAVLIEDSAQAFPSGKEDDIWQGDIVVLSFGRGKPVSLLGGGAILTKNNRLADAVPVKELHSSMGLGQWLKLAFKAGLYNRLVSPRLYWLPLSLPFLHLGETRYHELVDIEHMDQARLQVLPANVAVYRNDAMQTQQKLTEMLAKLASETNGVIDLASVCQAPDSRRLLRYPVLVESTSRDRLYQVMRHHGLGASILYPAILPKIQGLESMFSGQGPFPAAEAFASSLLTLPTHQGVRDRDIGKIAQLLTGQ